MTQTAGLLSLAAIILAFVTSCNQPTPPAEQTGIIIVPSQ